MDEARENRPLHGPRCVALVGPYSSGKTTLLESILFVTGATHRKGSITAGNTVGDNSPEARAHSMSVEANVASASYIGDAFTFIDCPGSVEFLQDSFSALVGVDAAVVVCEPDPAKIESLAPLLHHLNDNGIPYLIFINKIDRAESRLRAVSDAVAATSPKPVVLRQIPIRKGREITGFVDLASERAYVYRDSAPSEIIDIPADLSEREAEDRYAMLETLADFDDHLMEELLEDENPPAEEVFADLAKDLEEGLIVPVLFGSAEQDHGIRRLLKALRHEVPGFERTRERLGLALIDGDPLGVVLKNYHTARGGKLSVVRVLRGRIDDGQTLGEDRISGVYRLGAGNPEKLGSAGEGDVVALGRMEGAGVGDTLRPPGTTGDGVPKAPILKPVYGLALNTANRNDEVKLTGVIAKLIDEDPSYRLEQDSELNQMVLWGQGDIHIRVALEKCKSKYGLEIEGHASAIPYKEAIRKPASQRGRHKKQTGGHGQFGDVVLEIAPVPRGTGFVFEDKIVGGVVPRQFISSVEAGVKDYLSRGPLGFPVVDIAVKLVDGSHHSVDSSDAAFRAAGRLAMSEALPNCDPVVLEPIWAVRFYIPSAYTSKVNALISGRRGQILGFDAREGWPGWDAVDAQIPQAEMQDIIVELRSLTHGTGTFDWRFDHLSELTGRLAERVAEQRLEQATS